MGHLLWIIEAVLHLHQDVHVFTHHFLTGEKGGREVDDVNLSLTELLKGEVTDVADNYIHFNGPLVFFFQSHRRQRERSYKSEQM